MDARQFWGLADHGIDSRKAVGTGGCRQKTAKCGEEGSDDAVDTTDDGSGFEVRDGGSGKTLVDAGH